MNHEAIIFAVCVGGALGIFLIGYATGLHHGVRDNDLRGVQQMANPAAVERPRVAVIASNVREYEWWLKSHGHIVDGAPFLVRSIEELVGQEIVGWYATRGGMMLGDYAMLAQMAIQMVGKSHAKKA